MLDNTLAFKKILLESAEGKDIKMESFLSILNDCCSDFDVVVFSKSTDRELRYLHAALLSAFFELTEYSLHNWNQYFIHFEDITRILKVKKTGTEGNILELLVLHTINQVFKINSNKRKVRAYIPNSDNNPSYLLDDSFHPTILDLEDNERLINNLTVKMKIRGEKSEEIWGDNDVVVCVEDEHSIQQFCIISCKVSLRERVYQSLFWSLHSRLEGAGRHVFITVDKGSSDGKSEIGSRSAGKKVRKTRNVLESTMDRVYVFRGQDEVSRSPVIKDFKDLKWDLKNWSKDFTGRTKP